MKYYNSKYQVISLILILGYGCAFYYEMKGIFKDKCPSGWEKITSNKDSEKYLNQVEDLKSFNVEDNGSNILQIIIHYELLLHGEYIIGPILLNPIEKEPQEEQQTEKQQNYGLHHFEEPPIDNHSDEVQPTQQPPTEELLNEELSTEEPPSGDLFSSIPQNLQVGQIICRKIIKFDQGETLSTQNKEFNYRIEDFNNNGDRFSYGKRVLLHGGYHGYFEREKDKNNNFEYQKQWSNIQDILLLISMISFTIFYFISFVIPCFIKRKQTINFQNQPESQLPQPEHSMSQLDEIRPSDITELSESTIHNLGQQYVIQVGDILKE